MAELRTAYEKWLKRLGRLGRLDQDIELIDPFTGEHVNPNLPNHPIVFEPTAMRFEIIEKATEASSKKTAIKKPEKDLGDFSDVVKQA